MIADLLPLATDDTELTAFGHDPWWVIGLKTLLIFVFLVLLTLFNIWWERRVVARMQHRIGPNVHGPFGLLQSLADGVKLALKEDLTPVKADKLEFILAIASIGIYGIVLAGWSSGSTYSLLGGLRSSAQMISYEVAMGLALVAVFLYAGSMSTSEIVDAQASIWYGLILLPSFVIFMISMVGETNRAPF